MKVLHVSTSDSVEGAARAAHRIHRALVREGVCSRMRVLNRRTSDPEVAGGRPPRSLRSRLMDRMLREWQAYRRREWCTDNPVFHTFGKTSAGLVEELNSADADILNLHWISGMLSIRDVGSLKKPVVWTFHDMWPFCGGEHYVPDAEEARFRCGYRPDNRSEGERGPDLNRLAWLEKKKTWGEAGLSVVSPSRWLARCVAESLLFGKAPIHVVPNPLDTEYPWRPVPPETARAALGLPMGRKLVLMGAYGGVSDPRKGGDLLREASRRFAAQLQGKVDLVIYGQDRPGEGESYPCTVHWLGRVQDDRVLALAYAGADVMVVPSRQEVFGQTASEALACGTPVAAFEVGGLPDIVAHRETGWLARPFDTEDLAEGIVWMIADEERHARLRAAARRQAVERFAEPAVAGKYLQVYEKVLNAKR